VRVVLQRVQSSSVSIKGELHASIGSGLLILLGIEHHDNEQDIQWLCRKIANLRIFNDADGSMNVSIKDHDGEALVVSQFTLYAQTKKGNRPSYTQAAQPSIAIPLYKQFIDQLELELDKTVSTGLFGADMKVDLVNDGPVTIIIDTKNRE
jgi:D-tyrosyl-tRNA(Tyr) deacylase